MFLVSLTARSKDQKDTIRETFPNKIKMSSKRAISLSENEQMSFLDNKTKNIGFTCCRKDNNRTNQHQIN